MDGDDTLCMHYFCISKTRNWRILHLVTGSFFVCGRGKFTVQEGFRILDCINFVL